MGKNKIILKRIIPSILIILGIVVIITNTKLMGQNKKLEVGDKLPLFVLKDQNGEEFKVENYLGKQKLVVYFYPKDDTPGCTKEACKFRDDYEVFKDLNAKIIGISADDVASHKNFAAKYNLPFTLLSDENNGLRKSFGVPGNLFGLVPGRVTYVIGLDGKVKYIFNNLFQAEKHIEEAKKILQKN